MKTKKSIFLISIIFALALIVSLFAACGEPEDPSEDPNALAPHHNAKYEMVKKGVCVADYNDGEQNAQRVDDLGVSWYYNWGLKPENEYINAEFIPMVWGDWAVTDENIAYIKENYESGKFTHLLTFNEPDLPDQANMTVEQALSYWEKLESIGIPLSGPVVSWYIGDGNEWLDDFMQKAEERGYRVDFITVHSYLPFYYVDDMVKSLKEDTLEVLYEKYHKPIWVTEFGAIDTIAREIPGRTELMPDCTEEKAVEFVKKVTDMLEQCEYVERYSWFLDNLGDNRPFEAKYTSLYDENDEITAVGSAYKNVKSTVPFSFETEELQYTKTGEKYSMKVLACGGTGDYEFSAENLPDGLTINKSGTIGGIATTPGEYEVSITATDSGEEGRRQTITRTFLLYVIRKN